MNAPAPETNCCVRVTWRHNPAAPVLLPHVPFTHAADLLATMRDTPYYQRSALVVEIYEQHALGQLGREPLQRWLPNREVAA